jgi:hypothetical protein
MVHREGDLEGHMDDGNVVMGQREECWEGNLGSGNVVMEQR